MFRSIVRVVVPVAMVSVSVLASLANAQVGMPNPIKEPNPLTATLSIFRSNMQDKTQGCVCQAYRSTEKRCQWDLLPAIPTLFKLPLSILTVAHFRTN